eukprot:6945328-Pyramimonas_sp.AAC.1
MRTARGMSRLREPASPIELSTRAFMFTTDGPRLVRPGSTGFTFTVSCVHTREGGGRAAGECKRFVLYSSAAAAHLRRSAMVRLSSPALAATASCTPTRPASSRALCSAACSAARD